MIHDFDDAEFESCRECDCADDEPRDFDAELAEARADEIADRFMARDVDDRCGR